jgi:Raf kinase inhibitor-like YbhB/YbcL family protein
MNTSLIKQTFILFIIIFLFGCISSRLPDTTQNIKHGNLTITSIAFSNMGVIPVNYTCKGDNINPPLEIQNIPKNATSLVLIVDDPDASFGVWDHWLVWNIPLSGNISENTIPGTQGINSWKTNNYNGPCPPSGKHRYFFKIFALDTMLDLSEKSGKKAMEEKMNGHIIAKGELIGIVYAKQ